MLQDHLFGQHKDIDYLGTFHHRDKRKWNKCRDAQVQELFDELVFERPRRPDLDRARALFGEAVAPSLEAGKIPVWSWESLALSSLKLRRIRAQNLRTVFGPCKVVMMLRSPLSLVESVYFQHLKRENVGGKYRRFKRPWLHSIESWLESSWGHRGAPGHHLDYPVTIDAFVEIFGRENVGVFLFEELVENSEGFVRKLCDFVGLEPEQAVSLTQQSRSNDRWTQHHLDSVERIASSHLRRAAFRFANKQGRLRMIGLERAVSAAAGARAHAPLPAHWRRQIEDRTAVGNQRLMAQWGLPLDRYGYPLPAL
jgi:hypothetical protein